jgi:hypothetical protein
MEPRNDGDGIVLDGEKVLVMDATAADFFLVATSDGRRHVVERRRRRLSRALDLDRPDPPPLLGPLRRSSSSRRTRDGAG